MAEEEFPNPTLEEFVTWLSPALALEALEDLSDDTAVRTILTRASNGLILGAATTARWRSGGKPRSAEIMAIPHDWWAKAEISHTWHSFWNVGDMVVRLEDGRYSTVEIHLFDVRFEPFGIHAISGGLIARSASTIRAQIAAPPQLHVGHLQGVPRASASAPDERTATPPAVATDAVRAWHRALSKSDKALGLRGLWAMAKNDLGSGVLRKQIEPFVAGRKRGPKGPRKG